jgi:hypothetical protein
MVPVSILQFSEVLKKKHQFQILIEVTSADFDKRIGLYRCFGSALVSIRIRIQGAKPMRINADPDPGQTLPSQKNHVSLGPYKKKLALILCSTIHYRY